MPPCYVYLCANRYRTVFYVGMTCCLPQRMAQHRSGLGSRFTGTYRVFDLVYYEAHPSRQDAMRRERQIKRWGRAKKVRLIREANPGMIDLASGL